MGIRRASRVSAILLVAALLPQSALAAAGDGGDWPTYGHDAGGQRHSPLTQITVDNVATLQPAWTYRMRPANTAAPAVSQADAAQRVAEGVAPQPPAAGPPGRRRANSRFSQSQATPLVVGGRMFLSTPYSRVVALEPETGKELWVYAVPGPGQPSLRGVEYWPGDAKHAPRILFGTRDGRLIALDAATGKLASGFGKDGILDLKTPGLVGDMADRPGAANYGMTSPPLIWRDLVITGAAVQENPPLGLPGDVRAWDVRTGELRWTFHTVPRPGETGHDSWGSESWKQRSGVNVWGFMTVDAGRGLVYLPVAAPAWDRYGGDRPGNNLFGTSIVALDARTGKRRWHFQVVHHDIWDFDTQAPPVLFEWRQGRRTVPAVGIVGKTGYLYVLDRRNGRPLHPIIETPVPASDVPGEQASPTQPLPLRPAPYARTSFSMADLATVTPELAQHCRQWIESLDMRMGGPFLPVGHKIPTINFPGRLGGANWGGASYNPQLGLLFVNSSDFGHVEQLGQREDGSWTNAGPATGRFMEREKRWPCQQPPWGTLTAIDPHKGEILWRKPLGRTDNLPDELADTGRPNIGGSISTAAGLVFVGATDDARLRAFDARSGEILWTHKLEASAHATPITYLGRDGRQYVAIVATGGSFLDSPLASDGLFVFALPAGAADRSASPGR
ncbi:MAG: hypothetical protein RL026_2449 [Pseudomonadota bacterium]